MEVPKMDAFYSFTGHDFILTKDSEAGNPFTPPADEDESSASGNSLAFISGTPSYKDEGWDNAVDGDLEGWDGTTTVRGDDSGAAWAIFGFSDGNIYQFDYFTLQTDNGPDDDAFVNRQAVRVEILTSQTGVLPGDFSSITQQRIKYSDMRWYPLGRMVSAKYVKLMIHEPKWGDGGWRQVVEFGVNTQKGQGAILASQETGLAAVPEEFRLEQNYPNPFNPETLIRYRLAADVQVTIKIFDVQGREVATLMEETQSAGVHSLQWHARHLPSGIYFCYLKAGSYKKINKMLLTK